MNTSNGSSEIIAKAQKVESQYRNEFKHPFPYGDCRKLHKLKPQFSDGFIPDLDLYLSFIAGYSSSATGLDQRPLDEIRNAIPRLKKSFFETHRRYKPLEELITDTETPWLHHELQMADELRLDLVSIMERLL